MLEWLKRHAWKACKPLKGFPSSNLGLSAERIAAQRIVSPQKGLQPSANALGCFCVRRTGSLLTSPPDTKQPVRPKVDGL